MQEKESIIRGGGGGGSTDGQITVWHHSTEPRDAKTMTLKTDGFVHPYLTLMLDSYTLFFSPAMLQ